MKRQWQVSHSELLIVCVCESVCARVCVCVCEMDELLHVFLSVPA